MGEARLNFVDHSDGTVSCQMVFRDGYDRASRAHQAARLMQGYLDSLREAVPGTDDEAAALPDELPTQAYMRLTDEGGSVRLQIECVPDAASPAYRACQQAKELFEVLHRAESDALLTRQDGLSLVLSRETINARAGHAPAG